MAERAGFDEFYLATRSALLGQLTAMTADRELAADVLPAAYARAWQRWDRVSGLDQPTAWVRRVAWRMAIRRLRGAQRRRVVLLEERVDLRTAMLMLSAEHRCVLALSELCGLPVAEIAAETGVPDRTVTRRLAGARATLASLVDVDGADPGPVLASYAASADATRLPTPSTVRRRGVRRTRRTRLASVVAVALAVTLAVWFGQAMRRPDDRPAVVHPLPIVVRTDAGLAYFVGSEMRTLARRPDPNASGQAVVSRSTVDEVCYGGCRIVGDSWSPDARRVVVVVAGGPGERAHVLLIEHGTTQKLFDCPARAATGCDWDVSAVVWSPDGQRLALTSDRKPYVYDLVSRRLDRLDCDGCAGQSPSWSPDGAWLTYLTDDGVYRVAARGGPPSRIAAVRRPTLAVWSPDQTRLAVSDVAGVRIVNVSDGRTTSTLPAASDALLPVWSPDGRFLAVLRTNPGSVVPRVLVVDAETGTGRLLRRFAGWTGASNLAWSPDGSRIAIGLAGIDRAHSRFAGAVAIVDAHSGDVLHRFAGFGPVAWLSR